MPMNETKMKDPESKDFFAVIMSMVFVALLLGGLNPFEAEAASGERKPLDMPSGGRGADDDEEDEEAAADARGHALLLAVGPVALRASIHFWRARCWLLYCGCDHRRVCSSASASLTWGSSLSSPCMGQVLRARGLGSLRLEHLETRARDSSELVYLVHSSLCFSHAGSGGRLAFL